MAKYQAYAEYKDSGVQWLGEIPSHWKLTRLKFLAKIRNGQDYKHVETETGFPVMGSGGQFTFSSTYMFNRPSVLLGRKGTIDKPLYIDEPFWTVDTMYYTEVNKDIDVKYFYYLSKTILFNRYSTNTALPSMTQENLNNFEFSVPPSVFERNQIRNFLDHETTKIDHLIQKQQQLIELLKEKRQAVISHAVTKGLNPNVPMKDSGVEWLGEVPEHWDTTKIKYVAELTPKKSEVSSNDNRLCTFVPMEKLKLGSLIKDEEKPISEVIGGYTYFKNGDLLLAKVTPCFENKNMVVASDLKNGIGFGSSEIYVLRTNHKVNTQFLYYRLQEDQFMELGTGAMTGAGGLKRVPSEFLNNFEFALPPLSEQIAITKYLNQYLIKNEYLMNKAQSAIQLMQERRTALISAAVTGKIDVRNWQAPSIIEADTELSA